VDRLLQSKRRRFIACSPILEAIDLSPYLSGIEHITVSGESGREARVCDFEWVKAIGDECEKAGTTFWFKGTGSKFRKDGIVQTINPFKQGSFAKELGIDIVGDKKLF
jgi:protein gp37